MLNNFYSEPTADWLSVSTPKDTFTFIESEVRGIISAIPDITALPDYAGWAFPDGGRVKLWGRGRVNVISASGKAIVAMRAMGLYGEYLRALSSEVHNVTRLDVALDMRGLDTPAILDGLYQRGVSGGVRLTRKGDIGVRRFSAPFLGCDTGTVYFGDRGANRVAARVYDKRFEVYSKTGVDVAYPWLRYEIEVMRMSSPTLRDAWEPAPLFWHFAGRDGGLLPRPGDVPDWVPGQPFTLSPLPPRDELAAFRSRLERSSELSDLLRQAASLGLAGDLAFDAHVRHVKASFGKGGTADAAP